VLRGLLIFTFFEIVPPLLVGSEPEVHPLGADVAIGWGKDEDDGERGGGPTHGPSFAEPEDSNRGDGKCEPVPFVDPSDPAIALLDVLQMMLDAALDPVDIVVVECQCSRWYTDLTQRAQRVDVQPGVDAATQIVVEEAIAGGANRAAARGSDAHNEDVVLALIL
jgi:hypothetical protein